SWCFHGVGSSNAPLLGSTAAEGLQRIGRTSIATRWRFCGLPQSASCSENFVIPPDVFGQTLSVQKVGREALKLWIEPLADYLASKDAPKPPRGLEQVLRDLSHEQLAFLALRSIMDQIHFGWDKRRDRRKKGGKRKVRDPNWLFCLELGEAVRDELEFAGLL